jgi:ribose/xylose/arabinose/galactoside ABC-type transport system permease subunit
MTRSPAATRRVVQFLQLLPAVFFAVIVVAFSALSDRFFSVQNFTNILLQATHLAVMAVGMTFVLLVAGVDLSVGATMYVAAVLLGLFLPTFPPWLCLVTSIAIGLACGAVNAFFVVKLRVAPFIVTLATLFIGRGLGLYLSGTKMVPASPTVLEFARGSLLGVPVPIVIAVAGVAVAFVLLRLTPFGRYVYAIGGDREGARKSGINVAQVTFALYCLCGAFAAVGGFISVSQVAAASSTFGEGKEFLVIAAAVLGGTSLFGGHGGLLGPIFGAILIQTVQNGLVMVDADPYIYPLITATIIFVAVLVDSLRASAIARLERRRIRMEEPESLAPKQEPVGSL